MEPCTYPHRSPTSLKPYIPSVQPLIEPLYIMPCILLMEPCTYPYRSPISLKPYIPSIQPLIEPCIFLIEPLIEPCIPSIEPLIEPHIPSIEPLIEPCIPSIEPCTYPHRRPIFLEPYISSIQPHKSSPIYPQRALHIPSQEPYISRALYILNTALYIDPYT